MKKITLITFAVLLLCSVAPVRAVVHTGAMDNRSGFPFIPGFTGQSMVWTTGGNAKAGLRLEWRADNETTPGFWTYTYRVLRGTAQNKGFAFFDIETASDFTTADIQGFQVLSATDRNGADILPFSTITLSNPVNFNAVHDFSNAAVTEASSVTALNKSDLSHYSGDSGRVPAGEPGGAASDTPAVGPVPHPFFGLRVTFPGSSMFSYTVTAWEFRIVANRAPMWGSFFGWGDQTAMAPFWYTNFYSNNIDNPLRLTLAPADSPAGAPPHQGWILVPGPLPSVISTTAADGATGVPVTDPVTAVLSGEIDPLTITSATFNLGGGINGTVSYDQEGRTATFTPDAPLPGSTAISATITTGVRDLAGNAMAAAKVWSFTTAAADTVAPQVVATVPGNDATFVPVTARVSAVFSEAIDPVTLTANFTVEGVSGTTSYNAATRTAVFSPVAPLANGGGYVATIAAGVTDLAGNAIPAPKSWSFTTIPAETVLPMVLAIAPKNGAAAAPATQPVTATFSEAIDPATLTNANFSIAGVTGTAGFDAATRTAVFTPDVPLSGGITYNANITTGVKDLAGNALPKPLAWSFTTLPSPPPAQLPDGILIPGETRATVQDALKVLRITLGIIQATPDDLSHGDVAPLGPDGNPQPDGTLDIRDAIVILRKAVGLINW